MPNAVGAIELKIEPKNVIQFQFKRGS